MSMREQPSEAFLCADDEVINHGHPQILALAAKLSGQNPEDTARNCFDWVRDQITHSIDFHREEVTCLASDVLGVGTGLCIAKSHLLVALWRAHRIPSGFCYQRLALDGPSSPYCTHGFVAVWLEGTGWYRCDARGNSKPGIHCTFTPGHENLAYATVHEGEHEYPGIWAQPWPELVTAMKRLKNISHYLMHPIDAAPPPFCDHDHVVAYRGGPSPSG
ncbi:transglutaminase-like domain-containing protein [Igneacidithiobacillus copahuensis]|nr:transglutaminase family protein [Igneacidithiobacillus copahuensis]